MAAARYRLTIPSLTLTRTSDIVLIAAHTQALLTRSTSWQPYVHDRRRDHIVCRITLTDGLYTIDAFHTYAWNKPADHRPDWADQLDHILNQHQETTP